jgi:citrate synthase
MKAHCDNVLPELGTEDDLRLNIAQRLDKVALEDDYFISKKMYPNVDFYSGIILRAMRILISMFTVIFTIRRTPRWIAHWKEMVEGEHLIGRPRQLYQGENQRQYPSR